MSRFLRKDHRLFPLDATGGIDACHQPRGSRLHIALHPCHLTGKKQVLPVPELQGRLHGFRGIDKGIPVHDAITDELGIFQSRYQPEDTSLLRPLQVCLKAHDVVKGALRIILPQLHHCMGKPPGMGIFQPHRLQRAKQQGILSPGSHFLHRHAALKENLLLKAVGFRLFRIHQLLPEMPVLLPVHGAVDICRLPLVVTGGLPGLGHIH